MNIHEIPKLKTINIMIRLNNVHQCLTNYMR